MQDPKGAKIHDLKERLLRANIEAGTAALEEQLAWNMTKTLKMKKEERKKTKRKKKDDSDEGNAKKD